MPSSNHKGGSRGLPIHVGSFQSMARALSIRAGNLAQQLGDQDAILESNLDFGNLLSPLVHQSTDANGDGGCGEHDQAARSPFKGQGEEDDPSAQILNAGSRGEEVEGGRLPPRSNEECEELGPGHGKGGGEVGGSGQEASRKRPPSSEQPDQRGKKVAPRNTTRKIRPLNYAASACNAASSSHGSTLDPCDALVQFELIHSTRRHGVLEIALPASFMLSSLAEKILSLDKWCLASGAAKHLASEAHKRASLPHEGDGGAGGELRRSVDYAEGGKCLIVIRGQVYSNDEARKDAKYCEEVAKWTRVGMAEGHLSTAEVLPMESTRLSDLVMEIGASYVLCHAGRCEHELRVTCMRLRCALDPEETGAYPHVLRLFRPHKRKCEVCQKVTAEIVAYGSHAVLGSPGFLCRLCHSRAHGLRDDKLLGPIKPNFCTYLHN